MFQAGAPGRTHEPRPLRSRLRRILAAMDVAKLLGGPAGFAPALAESRSAVLLLHQDLRCSGCPGRPRTCSRRLNRAPLSRLSYWTTDWYRPVVSNHAPPAYRAGALPHELDRCMAGAPGFEPGTSGVRGRRSAAELRPGLVAGASPPFRAELSGASGRRCHQTS